MDWNGNLVRPFVPRPDNNSFNFVYNYNYDQFPEMKHAMQAANAAIPAMEKNSYGGGGGGIQDQKKKRLTSDQLESLENSFQEEIKLDPDRKMKLAKELGLQPRQIAVWFQNRRARWKAKQLERLYDALKQEFDVVSMEKQKLQEEVLALRAILKEQTVTTTKQVSTGYKEISGEETVESTSILSSNNRGGGGGGGTNTSSRIECNNYVYNVDEYNTVMQPSWSGLPSYP